MGISASARAESVKLASASADLRCQLMARSRSGSVARRLHITPATGGCAPSIDDAGHGRCCDLDAHQRAIQPSFAGNQLALLAFGNEEALRSQW